MTQSCGNRLQMVCEANPLLPIPSRRGGRWPMVNLIRLVELRDHGRDRGRMPGRELSDWLLQGGESAFTPQLQAVLAMIVGVG
jgi:hypothetical protein